MKIRLGTGEDFEAAVFGFSHLAIEKSRRRYRGGELPIEVCIKRVCDIQTKLGWSPKRPTTKISKALFRAVASYLGPKRHKLRMFCALGTALDFVYGTDLFFECDGAIVTVDLTISRRKVSPKAMVVITLQDILMDRYYKKASKIAGLLSQMQ